MAEGGGVHVHEFALDSDPDEEALVNYLNSQSEKAGNHGCYDDDANEDNGSEDDDGSEDDVPLVSIQWISLPTPFMRSKTLPDLTDAPQVRGEHLDDKSLVDFFNLMFPEGLHEQTADETMQRQ